VVREGHRKVYVLGGRRTGETGVFYRGYVGVLRGAAVRSGRCVVSIIVLAVPSLQPSFAPAVLPSSSNLTLLKKLDCNAPSVLDFFAGLVDERGEGVGARKNISSPPSVSMIFIGVVG